MSVVTTSDLGMATLSTTSDLGMSTLEQRVAHTSLTRVGRHEYTAMLMASNKPTGWGKETLLLCFSEANGACTPFVITNEALPQFERLEVNRVYVLQITGSCVKTCDALVKYGVRSLFEVRIQKPIQLTLATAAFTPAIQYQFCPWVNLNQQTADAFIDLVGRVPAEPERDQNCSIPKFSMQLGFGDFRQTIIFLGNLASARLHVGDIVLLRGLRVKEWRRERTLETSLLTTMEVNPRMREGLHDIESVGDEEPMRKAMRMSAPVPQRIADALAQTEELLQMAPTAETREFVLAGNLTTVDATFFVNDPPIVGEPPREKMCWSTNLEDDSGRIPIKIWDKGCYELFGMTCAKLRAVWEEGVADASRQTAVLEMLNSKFDRRFLLSCTARIWSTGGRKGKHQLQVDVNLLEDESGTH